MNTETALPENPLLATLRQRLPGETFRLPSGGIFYRNGELSDDVSNGEVHVLPMTALDEITLKSPDKLLNGAAIEEVFGRCIPQIKKPMELLSRDVDYLMMCLRMLSYGPTMALEYTHNCEDAKPHQYEIEIRPLLSAAKSIDPTTIEIRRAYTTESGQVVRFKPPIAKVVFDLYQAAVMDKTTLEDLNTAQAKVMGILASMIESVDSITDQPNIIQWLQALPAGWIQMLNAKANEMTEWGVNTLVKVKCQDCGKEAGLEVPANPISFFI